ncbi:hypothetical protein BD770DRAFT_376936 [Pilaira anomala]|nr:hypothetical protein BD770DRAFT_376936 [Pilaira anomala]
MRRLQLFVLFITFFGTNVESIELKARGGQECAFLSKRIYCFGGYIEGVHAADALNSLDIYKNDGAPSYRLNDQWEEIEPAPTDLVIGRRDSLQAAAAPDGVRFLFQGGFNYVSDPILHQTIAYNSETNTWETFANYNDIRNDGDREVFYGRGVYVPSLDGFGFFGGKQAHAIKGSTFVTLENRFISNITFQDTDNITSSIIGFYYFTLFDIKTNTWTVPTQRNVPSTFRLSFSATYHPGTKKVFYIGGSYNDVPAGGTSLLSSMSYANTFDTVTGDWQEQFIYGKPPSKRQQHTATLLANGDDILLYGGATADEKAMPDYCYTLNVPTMSWTAHDLVAPDGVVGPRSEHSAVLVNNSLFILFGRNLSGRPLNQLLILNVRDVNNITFANNFPFADSTDTTNGTKNSNGNDISPKEGLSTGGIAGVAVGAVIAGALAILGPVCYFLKRKTKQTSTRPNSTAHFDAPENNENDTLEVDWDKIENHYTEVNHPKFIDPSTAFQPQKPDILQQEPTQQHYISATNPHQYKPNVAEPILPNIVKPSLSIRPTKPDNSV